MTEDHDDPQISALYSKSRFGTPSRQTDAAIRRLAHEAVAGRKRHWFSVPQLAVAATLLLGVGLALRVFDVAPPEVPEPKAFIDSETPVAPAEPLRAAKPAPKAMPAPPASVFDDSTRYLQEELRRDLEQRKQAAQREYLERQRREAELRHIQAFCGDSLPDDPDDPQQWRERIAYLNQANEHALARCLQRLFEQRFPAAQAGE